MLRPWSKAWIGSMFERRTRTAGKCSPPFRLPEAFHLLIHGALHFHFPLWSFHFTFVLGSSFPFPHSFLCAASSSCSSHIFQVIYTRLTHWNDTCQAFSRHADKIHFGLPPCSYSERSHFKSGPLCPMASSTSPPFSDERRSRSFQRILLMTLCLRNV